MQKVISTENKPIKLWLNEIEENALQQAKNLANLPFVHKHIALMPDAHCGYGMPIGGVLATKGVIIPNAVGVDIGCGMCAMRSSLEELNVEELKTIMSKIRSTVPLGKNWHKEKQEISFMPEREKLPLIAEQQYQRAIYQIGTLGGGNHFIEIQKGSDGFVWVMIHSGSRNIGKMVADYYNKLAKKLNARWHTSVPAQWDLAFLPVETDEAHAYMEEMKYCVDFAFSNRKLMMERIKSAIHDVSKGDVKFDDIINIAHNYAAWENHFGENVLVHRKGATPTYKNQLGIIPANMVNPGYIVSGKENCGSLFSASHGAGRKMSRQQAKNLNSR